MKKEIKEQKTKESLASKILRYTDFSDGMKSVLSFSLTSKGKIRTVLVGGVKKIKKYTEGEIALDLHNEDVIFLGKNMLCVTYASGAIEISGEISDIKLCVEQKKK